MKVKRALAGLVPVPVVTSTLALPALPGGVVQVAVVALVTLKLAQDTPPMPMLVAPVKAVPVIVIEVPPSVVPEEGVTDKTCGAGGTGAT
jgi:hypothetical protein